MAGAHIGYEHGTKTGKACSSRSARARVDNSGSPKFKQLGGERLRSRITCGRKTIGMVAVFPRSAKIMEFRAEVRQAVISLIDAEPNDPPELTDTSDIGVGVEVSMGCWATAASIGAGVCSGMGDN